MAKGRKQEAAAQDLYAILGVARNADEDAIRKTYRKLARRYHPDVNPGDKAAEDRFKEISRAYDVLSDPAKRRKYWTSVAAQVTSPAPSRPACRPRGFMPWICRRLTLPRRGRDTKTQG